jgi:metal-responsive CopG/Arc/MetJ family transcriptional regulator
MYGRRSAAPTKAIQVRLQKNLLCAIESFRRSEPDIPTRPEAVRRLLQRAVMTRQKQVGAAEVGDGMIRSGL